jgi:hypothetical protein
MSSARAVVARLLGIQPVQEGVDVDQDLPVRQGRRADRFGPVAEADV